MDQAIKIRSNCCLIRYHTDEERKRAITRSETKYMVNKEWIYYFCGGRNYTLAGKTQHLHTKKHLKNSSKSD